MIELTDTNSAAIAAEFVRARTKAGSPAMGMVMTLIIVVDEDDAEQAMSAARAASHEHPARVLGVILGDGRGAPMINAQVGTGSGWSGETALIRLKGEVVRHPESVVLPLLLPDSPVAIWWPANAPDDPASDPLGALAQRRITDAAATTKRRTKAIHTQCSSYAKGNTDLAWTRVTSWRALLAAALDQHPLKVTSASVTGERVSPSAELLAAWLGDRLKVDVKRQDVRRPRHHRGGPGHQGRADPDQPRGRQAGDVHLPRPPRPADRAQAPRAARAAGRGAAPAGRGRRVRRHRSPAGQGRECPMSSPRIEVHEDAAALAASAAGELLARLATAQEAGRDPDIALTGGTIAHVLHRELARLSPGSGVDWTRVGVWFGDERFVGPGSPDRNAGQARAAFLDAVGATRVHEMPSTESAANPDEGAAAYAQELREHGTGEFEIVMLGIGPDGHIASLFPGAPTLDVEDKIAVGVTGSPKPPPERISLTFAPLRRARSVWFLVSGEDKSGAVAQALGGADLHDIPAAGVVGREETIWFLDRASASAL